MSATNLTTLNIETALQVNGTEVLNNTAINALMKVKKATLGTTTGVAGVINWQNPEGAAIIITQLVLDITTAASGTPTIDAGTATSATGTSDNVIDGGALSAIAVIDSIINKGTNGTAPIKLPASQYLVGAASTDPASLVGSYYIYYHLA